MPSIPTLELLEKIGEGGMGVVYRAPQITLEREVAVNILRIPTGDRAALPDRQKESRVLAALARAVDARRDLFSLATLKYEQFTGRPGDAHNRLAHVLRDLGVAAVRNLVVPPECRHRLQRHRSGLGR